MNIRTGHGRASVAESVPAVLRPEGRRSAGVLDRAGIARCREAGVALGYDPVQIGWVRLDCADDIDPAAEAAPRLGFRPWRPADAGRLARLLSSPRVWRHLPERFPGPVDAGLAQDLIRIAGDGGHQEVRAIEREGEVVGQIRLLFDRAGDARDEAEISYWLGEEHWGRGIASAAVAAWTARSFRAHAGLRRIFARVHGENPASVRVLEKAGYRRRGPAADDPAWLILDIARPTR